MKKFSTLAMVAALTTAMAIPAFASQDVAVSSDGSFSLTVDTTGVFTTDEDEYAFGWLQTYGADITVTQVTITYNGEEVDVTSYATLDGSDGNYTLRITTGDDGEGYFADNSTLDGVTAITYYVTAASTDFDNNWAGGAVGYNDNNNGWTSAGQWTSATDDSGKEFYLVLSDDASTDGDVAPVAYLAAVVALAGVALVASKKVRA